MRKAQLAGHISTENHDLPHLPSGSPSLAEFARPHRAGVKPGSRSQISRSSRFGHLTTLLQHKIKAKENSEQTDFFLAIFTDVK